MDGKSWTGRGDAAIWEQLGELGGILSLVVSLSVAKEGSV